MKILTQVVIILLFYFAGELIRLVTNVPIPGSVIGLVLLFLALLSGKIKVQHIEESSSFFLSNFSLLFIPPVIGLMDAYGVMKSYFVEILIIVFLGTFFMTVVTGLIVQKMIERSTKE